MRLAGLGTNFDDSGEPESTIIQVRVSHREDWLQRVRFTAAQPASWLRHARTLRQAAHDLWASGNEHERNPGSELGTTVLVHWSSPDSIPIETGGSTRDVCFMLFGFALENLAKGIIVCRDPRVVTRGGLRKWHGSGHDLPRLFDRAAISISGDERELLTEIARTTEWKGRYPVAMDFDKVGGQDRVFGHTVVSNVWPADQYNTLCSIFERAKSTLVEALQHAPPLPENYVFES